MEQPPGEVHAAPQPARQVAHRVVGPVGHAEAAQQRVDAAAPIRAVQPIEGRLEAQVFADGQGLVERFVLKHRPDPSPNGPRLPGRVEAKDPRPSLRRRHERGQDPKERRLAAAVGAEQAVERARGHLERNVLQRPVCPVAVGHALNVDGGDGHVSLCVGVRECVRR